MADELNTQLTRKQFIKLLIAGGTATAAATFFPGKWVKPLIKVGVLPVHAQSSLLGTITLTNFVIGTLGTRSPAKGRGLASPMEIPNNLHGDVHYEDSIAGIDNQTKMYLDYNGSYVIFDYEKLVDIGATITGTPSSGSIGFDFFLNYGGFPNGTFTLQLDDDGSISDPIYGTVSFS